MQTFAQQPATLTLAYFAYHCLPSPTLPTIAYPAYIAYLPTIAYPAYLAYPPPTMKRGQPSRNCPHFSYKECKR